MQQSKRQLVTKTLIMYMVGALLFLTFVELHIHTQEAAVSETHGFAVSISNLTEDLAALDAHDEISVSPDSILKIKQTNVSVLAIFMLIAVLVSVLCCAFIGRMRESHKLLPVIPFYGTPPLRAPPL